MDDTSYALAINYHNDALCSWTALLTRLYLWMLWCVVLLMTNELHHRILHIFNSGLLNISYVTMCVCVCVCVKLSLTQSPESWCCALMTLNRIQISPLKIAAATPLTLQRSHNWPGVKHQVWVIQWDRHILLFSSHTNITPNCSEKLLNSTCLCLSVFLH